MVKIENQNIKNWNIKSNYGSKCTMGQNVLSFNQNSLKRRYDLNVIVFYRLNRVVLIEILWQDNVGWNIFF